MPKSGRKYGSLEGEEVGADFDSPVNLQIHLRLRRMQIYFKLYSPTETIGSGRTCFGW